MNQLSTDARVRVISCLIVGCSQRSTTRMTGVAKKTVARLAMEIGAACQAFAERALVNLPRLERHEVTAPEPEEIAAFLVSAHGVPALVAQQIAFLCGGNVRAAEIDAGAWRNEHTAKPGKARAANLGSFLRMKTHLKTDLLRDVTRLRAENDVLNLALADAIAGAVTWFRRGATILGISRECGAAGGILIERGQDVNGVFYFVGAYYWETWFAQLRERTCCPTDAEGIALRDVARLVRDHVSKRQAEFYAPKTLLAAS